MTTITGCENYRCPICGQAVRAVIYGSMNSWSYPGSGEGPLINGVFGGGLRNLRCEQGHEFTSAESDLVEIVDYQHAERIKGYSILERLLSLLRNSAR